MSTISPDASWIGWLLVLFALLATVLLLGWMQHRSSRQMVTLTQQMLLASETARQKEQETARESMLRLQSEMSSQLSASAAASQQAILQTVQETTRGTSQVTLELAKTTEHLTTLLATKDPIAYQMATGAQAMTSFETGQLYTSTEDLAQEDAQQKAEQARIVEQGLAAITKGLVGQGGNYGDPQ